MFHTSAVEVESRVNTGDSTVPTFDLQPTLTGEILELRPLREEDYPALYAVASDPLIWAQHPNSDRHQEDVFKAFFREAIESGGHSSPSTRRTAASSAHRGTFGFDAEKGEVEIGWTFLARSHWAAPTTGR